MRKIREVLRLVWGCGLSGRQAAAGARVAETTVREYLGRARRAALSWASVEAMAEEELEARLYPPPVQLASEERPLPDWVEVDRELRRGKGVTLALVWEEYRGAHPEAGYRYSRFCELFRQWRRRVDLVMRQEHKAGEAMFVDYAGLTVPVVDPATGEVREAQVFVSVLGASNYTYAEATWSQALPDWIGSHVRAFEFYGVVPERVVNDNLKSGVTRACRWEPEINPTYHDLAVHYGVAVLPTRVRKPRDKAKVEVGVQVVERWVLARLRKRTFFSLSELNEAIRELLVWLNERPFRKLPGCRRERFEQIDRPAMKPLPPTPYEYAEWRKARVNVDYHVEVEGHYYSVPYTLVGRQLDVRLSGATVECFAGGQRMASHKQSALRGHHTTVAAHMPRAHRDYAEWTPERLVRWAAKAGEPVAEVVERILASRLHPQQGFRACLGLMRLGRRYGEQRLAAACGRALAVNGLSYRSVASILDKGLDREPLPEPVQATLPLVHPNLRGPQYYSAAEEVPC